MDKKTTFIGLGLIAIGVVSIGYMLLHNRAKVADVISDEAAWDLRDASPKKIVIITQGGMVARYLTEDEDNYIGDIQDSVWIPKSHAMIETWYASDGKGIVCLKEEGELPAYAEPDSTSKIVGKLTFESGYCPDSYDCLGYKDGWFKIKVADTEGYISGKYVYWDAIDTM